MFLFTTLFKSNPLDEIEKVVNYLLKVKEFYMYYISIYLFINIYEIKSILCTTFIYIYITYAKSIFFDK